RHTRSYGDWSSDVCSSDLHQVREIEEFGRLEVDNPEFLMALVDARHIAGDRGLFERFEAAFHHAGTHAHVVGALNGLIDERYGRSEERRVGKECRWRGSQD